MAWAVKWTDVMEARLRVHVKAKRSARVIAESMSEQFEIPFSRNMIIGKAHRLGLSIGGGPQVAKPRVRKPKPVERRAAPALIAPVVKETPMEIAECPVDGLSFDELPFFGRCKWPVSGAGLSIRFCGEEVSSEHVYCGCHRKLAFSPGTRSERQATIIKGAIQ